MLHRPVKKAACTLVHNPDNGSVLAISRGDDIRDWSIPGGGVDQGRSIIEPSELPHEAAQRELLEETGIIVPPQSRFVKLFKGMSRETITYVYMVHGPMQIPEVMKSKPFEGYVAWMKPEELCRPTCSFAEFQYKLFKYTGLL